MRRFILPALLLLLACVPIGAQYGRYGWHGDRDAQGTVASWYQRYLGRQPDPYSATWVQALRSGQEPEQVLSGILGSDEYYNNAGGRPASFVRRLFEDVVGRQPSRGEEENLVRQVYHRSRTDVAYVVLTRYAQSWDARDRDWSDRHDYRRPYSPYR